jgi:hypothetical protein
MLDILDHPRDRQIERAGGKSENLLYDSRRPRGFESQKDSRGGVRYERLVAIAFKAGRGCRNSAELANRRFDQKFCHAANPTHGGDKNCRTHEKR